MIRLTKDARTPVRLSPAEALVRLGVAMLRTSQAVHEFGRAFGARVSPARPARQLLWAQQYPVYSCPFAVRGEGDAYSPHQPGCGRRWDRRDIPTGELRAEVWEHLQAVHNLASATADMIVHKLMDQP